MFGEIQPEDSGRGLGGSSGMAGSEKSSQGVEGEECWCCRRLERHGLALPYARVTKPMKGFPGSRAKER